MKLTWTHEALNKLLEIEDFISEDSPTKQIIKKVIQLLTHIKGPKSRRVIDPVLRGVLSADRWAIEKQS